MITYKAGKADIAVIGAGHAGVEAALASARLGMSVLLFTINLLLIDLITAFYKARSING